MEREIQAGSSLDQIMTVMDVFPTLSSARDKYEKYKND